MEDLTNKEKTLMHLRDLYEQVLVTRFTAETGNCDEMEIYYSINDAGKIAFDELWDKYGEDDAGGGRR